MSSRRGLAVLYELAATHFPGARIARLLPVHMHDAATVLNNLFELCKFEPSTSTAKACEHKRVHIGIDPQRIWRLALPTC